MILLEYAELGDLFKFYKHLRKFNHFQMLTMFYKIVQSIHYLHSLSMVHRDIKPENIMINKKCQPKLGDFGTAGDMSKIHQTFCGTYEYMAPEVYLRSPQTQKVDIWALGILFYEMNHFITPFRNDTLEEIKKKIEEKRLKFKSDFPSDFIDFIYDLLKYNPDERPNCKQILNHKIFDCLFEHK